MALVQAPSTAPSASLWEQAFDKLTEKEQSRIELGKSSHADASIPADLMSGIEKQKRRCESKQWVLYTKKDGTEVKVREVLEKVAEHFDRFKGIANAAVSFAPAYASVPWAVVGFILQSTTRDVQKFAEMIEGIELVAHNIIIFAELEKDYLVKKSTLKSELSYAIVQLYTSMLRYLVTARAYYGERTPKRVWKSFFEDAGSTSALMDQIREKATNADRLAKNVAHEDANASLRAIEKHLASTVSSAAARREKLVELLNATHTDGRFGEALRKRHENTCDWIHSHHIFREWTTANAGVAKFLWIYGAPGFGKTFLSARIVDHLRQQDEKRVAYFFVSDEDTSHTPNAILRSWISQLIQQNDEAIPIAEKVLPRGAQGASQLVNSDFWRLLSRISNHLDGVTLVLDGLDELSPTNEGLKYHKTDGRAQFLQDLKESVRNTSAHVLVISRDVADIRQELSLDITSDNTRFHQYQITQDDNSSDITAYSRKIYEDAVSHGLRMTRDDFVSLASEKSNGMFLWLRFLEEGLQNSHSQGDIGRVLQRMPHGIDEIYEKELVRTFGLHVAPEDRILAATILRWVLFAIRPMQLDELAEALILRFSSEELRYPREELPDCWHSDGVDESFVENVIKRPCGSLLTIQEPADWGLLRRHTVHFVHFSVKEFLLRPRRNSAELDMPDFSDSSRQNICLAKSCLRYLCFDVFGDIEANCEASGLYYTTSESITNSEGSPLEPVAQQVTILDLVKQYPFSRYAAEYWHMHSSKQVPPDVMTYVKILLKTDTTKWKLWALFLEQPHTFVYFDDKPLQLVLDNHLNSSPIYYASLIGRTDVVKFLDGEGNDLEATGGIYGFSLQAASANNHFDTVGYLIESGASVNQEGGKHGTALFAAVTAPSKDIAQLLLERGASINSSLNSGSDALHAACRIGNADIASLILDALSDSGRMTALSSLDEYGGSVLSSAAKLGNQELVQMLLHHGADINAGSKTALATAIQFGNFGLFFYLLSRGADINAGRSTALENAISEDFRDIANLLLQLGADVNAGLSKPLQKAAFRGDLKLAESLLKHGADVNCNGTTVLWTTGTKGHLEMAELFLENGAVLDCAKKRCHDNQKTIPRVGLMSPPDSSMVAQMLSGHWEGYVHSWEEPSFIYPWDNGELFVKMSIVEVKESSTDSWIFKGRSLDTTADIQFVGQVCVDQTICFIQRLPKAPDVYGTPKIRGRVFWGIIDLWSGEMTGNVEQNWLGYSHYSTDFPWTFKLNRVDK